MLTRSQHALIAACALGSSAISFVFAGRGDSDTIDESEIAGARSSIPVALGILGLICLLFLTVLGLAGCLYNEYNLIIRYMTLGRFAYEFVRRLFRGEHPVPQDIRDARQAKAGAGGAGLTDQLSTIREIAVPFGSMIYRFASKYGIDGVDKVLQKYVPEVIRDEVRKGAGIEKELGVGEKKTATPATTAEGETEEDAAVAKKKM